MKLAHSMHSESESGFYEIVNARDQVGRPSLPSAGRQAHTSGSRVRSHVQRRNPAASFHAQERLLGGRTERSCDFGIEREAARTLGAGAHRGHDSEDDDSKAACDNFELGAEWSRHKGRYHTHHGPGHNLPGSSANRGQAVHGVRLVETHQQAFACCGGANEAEEDPAAR